MSGQAIETPVVPTADQIRAGLKRAEQAKRRARAAESRAVDDTRELLRLARETPGITIREAAEIAGISEVRAHELLREDDPKA